MDTDEKIITFLIKFILRKCKLQENVYLIGIPKYSSPPLHYKEKKSGYVFEYKYMLDFLELKHSYYESGGIYNFEEILEHIIDKYINDDKYHIDFRRSKKYKKIIIPYIKNGKIINIDGNNLYYKDLK